MRVDLFRQDSIVIRLGDERATDTGSQTQLEMISFIKRNLCKYVRRDGMPHNIVGTDLLAIQLPIAERHTDTRIVPFLHRLPFRRKRDCELTACSGYPMVFLTHHHIYFTIRHDQSAAER